MKEKDRKRRIRRESIRTAVTAALLLGASLCVFAWFHHARPVTRESAGILTATPTPVLSASPTALASENAVVDIAAPTAGETPAPVVLSWKEAYREHFSDTLLTSETAYSSDSVSVTITKVLYGNAESAVYFVADIYISDISCFKTVLAKDTYGSGIRETVPSMAQRSGAVLAMTGDTYGNQDAGVVIRNGVVDRTAVSGFDVCVLYYSGEMVTYSPADFSLEEAVANGAYQAWSFGPMLLDEKGNALPDEALNISKTIRRENPRAGLGYYAPGHYCFIVVDGRTDDESGLTLEEFGQVFASLGCKAAYNLDGGRSSFMVFQNATLNSPYKGGRSVSDCLIIKEADP